MLYRSIFISTFSFFFLALTFAEIKLRPEDEAKMQAIANETGTVTATSLYSVNKKDCETELTNRPTKFHNKGTITSFTADNVSKNLALFNVILQMSKVLNAKEACIHINQNDAANLMKAKVSVVIQSLKTADLVKHSTNLGKIINKMNAYDGKVKTYFTVSDITGYADQERIYPKDQNGDTAPTGVMEAIQGYSGYAESTDLKSYHTLLSGKSQNVGEEGLATYMSDSLSNVYLAMSRAGTLKDILMKEGAGEEVSKINLSPYLNGMSSCRNFLPGTLLLKDYTADTTKTGKMADLVGKGVKCDYRRKAVLDGTVLTFGEDLAPTVLPSKVDWSSNGNTFNSLSCIRASFRDKYEQPIIYVMRAYLKLFKSIPLSSIPNVGRIRTLNNPDAAELKAHDDTIKSIQSFTKDETQDLADLLSKTSGSANLKTALGLIIPPKSVTISSTSYMMNNATDFIYLAAANGKAMSDTNTNLGTLNTYTHAEALKIIQYGSMGKFKIYGAPERFSSKTVSSEIKWTLSKAPVATAAPTGNWTVTDLLSSYFFKDVGCVLFEKFRTAMDHKRSLVHGDISLTELTTLYSNKITTVSEMASADCIAQSPYLATQDIFSACSVVKGDFSSTPGVVTPGKNNIPHYGFTTEVTGDDKLIKVDVNIQTTLKTKFPPVSPYTTTLQQANSIICKPDTSLGFLPTADEQKDCSH